MCKKKSEERERVREREREKLRSKKQPKHNNQKEKKGENSCDFWCESVFLHFNKAEKRVNFSRRHRNTTKQEQIIIKSRI